MNIDKSYYDYMVAALYKDASGVVLLQNREDK